MKTLHVHSSGRRGDADGSVERPFRNERAAVYGACAMGGGEFAIKFLDEGYNPPAPTYPQFDLPAPPLAPARDVSLTGLMCLVLLAGGCGWAVADGLLPVPYVLMAVGACGLGAVIARHLVKRIMGHGSAEVSRPAH